MARPDPSFGSENSPKYKFPIPKAMLMPLIVSVLVIGSSLLFGLSTQPAFCGLCHKKEFSTWQRSSHQSGGCNYCHRSPGLLGIASQRFSMIQMVLRYPVGLYRDPVTATVDNKSCLRCHANVEKETVKRKGLRVSHKEPDKKGYKCSDCHGSMVHGTSVPGFKKYSMGTCLTCHTGDQSERCEICHIEEPPRERQVADTDWHITHGKNWRKLHGMGNLNTCAACHRSSEFCRRCHRCEVPHSSSWLNFHGKEAMADRDSCTVCHKSGLCTSCHGIEMPHPKTFLSKHSSIVKKNGRDLCNRCHHLESCDACHVRHTHPGIKQERIRELRRKSGLD